MILDTGMVDKFPSATSKRCLFVRKRQQRRAAAQFPVTALGRSRPAADASREVVERWLLDGLGVS
ncbi:MAG: hypothetical protein ACHQIK_22075, partial [Candidatus Acidiferrales bacterium]